MMIPTAARPRRGRLLRGAIALSGSVALIAAMSACAPTGGEDEDVVLQLVRPGRLDVVEATFSPIIAEFEAANPNITVELVDMGWDEYFERMPILLSTGTSPDVQLHQQGGLYEYAADDLLLPLDDYLDEELETELLPGLLETTTWEGEVVGIPSSVGSYVLWYRADIFEAAGLDPDAPPTTWDELLSFSNQIEERTGVPGFGLHAKLGVDLLDLYAYFYNSATGKGLWDEGADRIDWEDPGAVTALEFMRELAVSPGSQDHPDQYTRPDLRSQLRDGQIAMMFDGPWILNVIGEQLAGDEPTIRTAQVPAGPAGSHSISVVDGWAIPAHAEHPEESWKLLRFLVEAQNQAAHDLGYGSIPPQESMTTMDEFGAPYFTDMVDALDDGFTSRPKTGRYGEINQRLPQMVQRVVLGTEEPRAALERFAAEMGWD